MPWSVKQLPSNLVRLGICFLSVPMLHFLGKKNQANPVAMLGIFLITLVFYDFKKVITLSPNLLQVRVSFRLLEYCSPPLIFTEPLVGHIYSILHSVLPV
jgi:hypothetical protein